VKEAVSREFSQLVVDERKQVGGGLAVQIGTEYPEFCALPAMHDG
jgi:hypothetical protein